jgi:hypothetical protein
MKAHQISLLLGTLALTFSFQASAGTISAVTLEPSAALVPQTTTFTVDLKLNAPDVLRDAIRGRIIIDFDPALISYDESAADSLVLAGGLSFLPNFSPVVGSANGRKTITFGFQYAPDVGRVATFKFTAIGPMQSIASIGLNDASLLGTSFFYTEPTNQPFVPTFTGTSVQITAIPLPGAAWLLATAFGIAATRLRRTASRAIL